MKRLVTLFALMVMFTIGVQAQIVGANERQGVSTNTTSSSLYKPTGHYLRFEGGAIWGSVAYDYQINPYIMVGGGIGGGYADRYYNDWVAPVYAEAIFSTPRNKWSFYSEIKLGCDFILGYNGKFFSSLTVGANYKNFGLGIGCYMYMYDFAGIHYHSDYVFTPRFIATYKLPLKVY